MNSKIKWKCHSVCVFTGACLMIAIISVPWYWGNLSVYTLSYVVYHTTITSDSAIDTPWVISLFVLFRAVGLIGYDVIRQRFGQYHAVIIGIVLFGTAFLSSFFAVQNSLALLNAALGGVAGLASGILYGHSCRTVVDLSDKHVGLLTCLLQSSYGLGSMAVNQFVTMYTNPDNLSPKLKIGRSLYFTDTNLLERIPYVFLFIGGFSVLLHAIGLVLLTQRIFVYVPGSTAKEEEIRVVYDSTGNGSPELTESSVTKENARTAETNDRNYSPKSMLKTFDFYAFWLFCFTINFQLTSFNNYYKVFGQIWIQDDHFLTDLGTAVAIANAGLRPVAGIVCDKLKAKPSLILLLSLSILSSAWYYFSPMFSRWIYFVVTVMYGFLNGSLMSLMPVVTISLFGKTHFSANYGIIMTSCIAFHLVGPILQETLVSNYGWFVMFGSCAFSTFSSLLLILLFIH